jgi:hypothetical protein
MFQDKLIVAWSVECDSIHVTSLHWEKMLTLLEYLPSAHIVLCYGTIPVEDYTAILPARTIFTSTGARSAYNMCNLHLYRRLAGHGPPILFHFDALQEMSWHTYPALDGVSTAASSNASLQLRDDAVRCHGRDVPRAYANYALVVHNYMARSLFRNGTDASPVVRTVFAGEHSTTGGDGGAGGAGGDGGDDNDNTVGLQTRSEVHWWALGTVYQRYYRQSHLLGRITVLPSSQRAIWCMFAGRTDYYQESIFHRDRLAMREAVAARSATTQATSFSCQVVADKVDEKIVHEAYVDMLLQSVFTLCPHGSNPESYRLYEVLELGSVPVFVRMDTYVQQANARGENGQALAEGDFLQLWTGYPGPVFDSWEAALDYVEAVGTEEVEQVQQSVFYWYLEFKELELRRLRDAVDTALSVVY